MEFMKVVLIGAWGSIHRGGSIDQYEFWFGLVRVAMNNSPRLVGRASDELYDLFVKLGVKP